MDWKPWDLRERITNIKTLVLGTRLQVTCQQDNLTDSNETIKTLISWKQKLYEKRNGLHRYNFKLDQHFWEAIKADVRLDIKYMSTTDRQINKQLTEPKETRYTHPI